MEEQKIKELLEEIAAQIPQGKNITGIAYIKSFESLDKKFHKGALLDDLARNAVGVPQTDEIHLLVDDVDQYFKNVHAAVRAKAEKKSTLLVKALEDLLHIYFNTGSGRLFTKEEGLKALSTLMDYYDPNLNLGHETGRYNWAGFWSLITTKDGAVANVQIQAAKDLEIFCAALDALEILEEKEADTPAEEVQAATKNEKAANPIDNTKKGKKKKTPHKAVWIHNK